MKTIFLFFFLIFSGKLVCAQEQYILTSDSVNLYISVKGKGKPCLFIHGGPGSGSYWVEKFFGKELESHFKMIYLDQRGVGRSSSPKDSNYSMKRMVMDFEEIRNALKIKTWLTMGHSFGGILQMGYANEHPSVISGMIMVNCTLNMTESLSKTWIPKACEFLNLPIQNIYMNEATPILERLNEIIIQLKQKDLFWKMGFNNKLNSDKMDSTYIEIPNWNNDMSIHAMSINEYWRNYKPLSSKMKMPVLFFTGNYDWMAGPYNYKDVNFENMILYKSNVGHIPFMENKGDLETALEKYAKKYGF